MCLNYSLWIQLFSLSLSLSHFFKQNLQDQLGTKWRTTLKENDLENCSKLLAQILVHEKIMGFSVYTGFLLKEHEAILGSNRIRLIEIERKAHAAVKKIVR